MVNAAAAIDTGSSSLSLFSRAASVDAVLTSEATTAAVQQVATPANLGQTLRYNSFEFSYRQDFGKIVLLRQEPETGEVVQQFPTEYYLKRYAESQRAAPEKQAANESGAPDVAQAAAEPVAVGGGAPAPAIVAPVVASAPVISSAPALPSGGVGGGVGGSIGSGVDITI